MGAWTKTFGRVPGHHLCPLAGLRQKGVCLGVYQKLTGICTKGETSSLPLRIMPLCDYVNYVDNT